MLSIIFQAFSKVINYFDYKIFIYLFFYRFKNNKKLEILSYNREITESIYILYDNNQEYKEYAEILTQVHVDNNKLFSQLVKYLNRI